MTSHLQETPNLLNPYLFVVGCRWSGGKQLAQMLDRHPLLAIVLESQLLPQGIDRIVSLESEEFGGQSPMDRLVEWARVQMGSPAFQADGDATPNGVESARKHYRALYSNYASRYQKPLVGEAILEYVKHLDLLHEIFPEAKFVHVIHDGRDVALSMLNVDHGHWGMRQFRLWKKEPVAACALWWRQEVSAGRLQTAALGPGICHEIKADSFLADPEESLRKLVDFLEMPFAPEMLNHVTGQTNGSTLGSSDTKTDWPAVCVGKWQEQLSRREIELFEALAGDLLTELGYERATGETSHEIARLAKKCRKRWNSQHAIVKPKFPKQLARHVSSQATASPIAWTSRSLNAYLSNHPEEARHLENFLYYGGSDDRELSLFKELYKTFRYRKKQSLILTSVAGGLSFLNLAVLLKPKQIYVFDRNPLQLLMFEVVKELVFQSENKDDFLKRLATADYVVSTHWERRLQEHLAKKIAFDTESPPDQTFPGHNRRPLERSWRFALNRFEKLKTILEETPQTLLFEDLEDPQFVNSVLSRPNNWIFLSNIRGIPKRLRESMHGRRRFESQQRSLKESDTIVTRSRPFRVKVFKNRNG